MSPRITGCPRSRLRSQGHRAAHPAVPRRPPLRPAGRTPVHPHVPQDCRCDEHKYGHTPGTDAVLYSGPDVVHLLERAAIRDGRYVDAHAYANHALALLHAKCEAADMQTRLTLEPMWRALNQLAAWRETGRRAA